MDMLKQLSYSFSTLLHKCPRKYELTMLAGGDDTNATLSFGHAVGAGVQSLFVTGGDLEAAVWETFKAWNIDLLDDSEENKKKTFWFACAAVDAFRVMQVTAFKQWKVAVFDGKPATELSFQIDLGDGYVYNGHVDVVLQHQETGLLGCLECKTTGFKEPNEATYKNSSQGLGYSLILDAISQREGIAEESNYQVFYPVFSSTKQEWTLFPFAKSYAQRAAFLADIIADKNILETYKKLGRFPQHGESCFDFFRQCAFYDSCNMSNKVLVSSTQNTNSHAYKRAHEEYQFKFSFTELIESQLRLHQ